MYHSSAWVPWAAASVPRWREVGDSEISHGAELLTRFADGSEVGGVGRRTQDGSSVHSLGIVGEVVPFTEMGKNGD